MDLRALLIAAEAGPVSTGNPILDIALQYGLAGLVLVVGGWLLYKIAMAYLAQTNERIEKYGEKLDDKDKKLEEANEKRHSGALAMVKGINASTEKLEGVRELLEDVPEALGKISALPDRVADLEELVLGLYDAQDLEPPAKWRRRRGG